ncbi:hypothetical protein WJX73_003762 [Symbiochloris irregularis]|uniref:Fe2OG dioxygenase domain-containing protein n=1 Tax=Symbiochloris irregularis TaxID=706552 RepID=A0AAW1PN18_9CHLO
MQRVGTTPDSFYLPDYFDLRFYRPFARVPFIAQLAEELRSNFRWNGQLWNINHAICTHYKDGSDNIGFHDDKIRNITPGSPILIFSLGNSRDLQLKPNSDANKVVTVSMQSGSLFVLGAQTNASWKHAIPVAKDTVGSRISIIFRDIKTEIDTTKPVYFKKIWRD